ncbi:MAG: sigma-70 family RNA polymerase sigma factor [Armatimonadetes bacterium]|nr:sigma-70 family RNA polymerase sigma factor [Armatimonadota bacterium]
MSNTIPVAEKRWPRKPPRGAAAGLVLGADQDVERPTQRSVEALTYPTRRRLLTAREEVDLADRARRGDPRARQVMMEANIRLVMSIARRYTCKSLTFEDLVQEGIIGLLEAINKFDGGRGNRFSTYATYWIRQAIVRAIEKQDRMIRLPVYGCDAARRVERSQSFLSETLGRQASPEEVAEDTGLPVRLVKNVAQHAQDPLSLDVLVGDSEDTVFADLVVDEDATDPEYTALQAIDREALLTQVQALEPREQWVIEKRFGLIDGRIHTLKEIAEQLKMSREGVRHVQLRALRKLKDALDVLGRRPVGSPLG